MLYFPLMRCRYNENKENIIHFSHRCKCFKIVNTLDLKKTFRNQLSLIVFYIPIHYIIGSICIIHQINFLSLGTGTKTWGIKAQVLFFNNELYTSFMVVSHFIIPWDSWKSFGSKELSINTWGFLWREDLAIIWPQLESEGIILSFCSLRSLTLVRKVNSKE